MGIYSNNTVYGIQISNVNDEGDVTPLFELKYDTIMSDEQKRDVKEYYENLYNKQNLIFSVYTECSSTYEEGLVTPFRIKDAQSVALFSFISAPDGGGLNVQRCKQWFPISTKQFIDIFCNIH